MRISAFTFLTPLFGLLFGALLLNEVIGVRLVVALVFVALGISLVNRPSHPRP
jgi:drug/metabolite transporter (DMT)-like permease